MVEDPIFTIEARLYIRILLHYCRHNRQFTRNINKINNNELKKIDYYLNFEIKKNTNNLKVMNQ